MEHETRTARAEALQRLPRISTSTIETPAQFVQRLEDLAFEVADLLQEAKSAGDPQWWRYSDMLDDLMDLVDVVHRSLPTGESPHD